MTSTTRKNSATRLLESASTGVKDHHFIIDLDTLRLFSSGLVVDLSVECLEIVDEEINNHIESTIQEVNNLKFVTV
jgi:hypothetical protein